MTAETVITAPAAAAAGVPEAAASPVAGTTELTICCFFLVGIIGMITMRGLDFVRLGKNKLSCAGEYNVGSIHIWDPVHTLCERVIMCMSPVSTLSWNFGLQD